MVIIAQALLLGKVKKEGLEEGVDLVKILPRILKPHLYAQRTRTSVGHLPGGSSQEVSPGQEGALEELVLEGTRSEDPRSKDWALSCHKGLRFSFTSRKVTLQRMVLYVKSSATPLTLKNGI